MAGIDNVLASLGYSPTRGGAKRQKLQQAISFAQNEEVRAQKEEEREQKKLKNQMDFYRTVRDYLPPGEAYKVMKESYPDFPEQFGGAGQTPKERREDVQFKTDIDYKRSQTDLTRGRIGELQDPTDTDYKRSQTELNRAKIGDLQDPNNVDTALKKSQTAVNTARAGYLAEGAKGTPLSEKDKLILKGAKSKAIQIITAGRKKGMENKEIMASINQAVPEAKYLDFSDPDIQKALGTKKTLWTRTGQMSGAASGAPIIDAPVQAFRIIKALTD